MADQLPLKPFQSGQRQISAEMMNRIVDAINYEARTQYDDTIETVAGVRHHFSDQGRRGLWAKLTSESGGQYAWTEQTLTGYTFTNLTYGRSGTTSANYAKDPNGATGLAASTPVVWLTPGDPTQVAGVVSENWLITGYAASSSVPDTSRTVSGKVNLSGGQWLGAGKKNIEAVGIGYNAGSPWASLTGTTGVFGGSSGLLTSDMDFWAQQLLVGTTSGTRATMYSTASVGPTGGYSVGTAKGFSSEHFTSGGAVLLGFRPASAEGFEMDGTYSILFDTTTPRLYTAGGTGKFDTQVMLGYTDVATNKTLTIGSVAFSGFGTSVGYAGEVKVVDTGATMRTGQTTTLSGAIFTAGILTDASGYSVTVSGSSLTGTVDGGTW